jgi:monoamine oxidase
MEYLQVVGLVNGMLEADAASLDLRNPDEKFDEITFEEFLQRSGVTGDAYGLAATMVRALLGVEPSELSLSFYLDYIKSGGSLKGLGSDSADGAQHLRIRQG